MSLETMTDRAMAALFATMDSPGDLLKIAATKIAEEFGVNAQDLIVLYKVEIGNSDEK